MLMVFRMLIKNQKKTKIQKHVIYRDSNYIPFNDTRIIESSIFSNLWLQKFLYFNVYYSILFFFAMLTIYIYKLWAFDSDIYHIIRLILLFPWAILDVARLYGGYYGNIKETFPDLISFELLTMIATGILFVLVIFPVAYPLEYSLFIIAALFNLFELVIGMYTMSTLVRSQTALFFLRNPAQNARSDSQARLEKNIEMKVLQREKERKEDEEGLRRRDAGETPKMKNKRSLLTKNVGGSQYKQLPPEF